MLRYRVTSNEESIVTLFSSAEALFVWQDDPQSDIEGDIISLCIRPNDFMDFEWCGCEIVYHEGSYTILNQISVAFARNPENNSGHVVKTFKGWVSDHILPIREVTSKSLTIKRLLDSEGLQTSSE